MGTPPVKCTFLLIFWATCWYLILWENIDGKGWRGKKTENPGIGRFPQYLKYGDFPINQIFWRVRNTISRRSEKEIEGLAVPGCEKWPSAWGHQNRTKTAVKSSNLNEISICQRLQYPEILLKLCYLVTYLHIKTWAEPEVKQRGKSDSSK